MSLSSIFLRNESISKMKKRHERENGEAEKKKLM